MTGHASRAWTVAAIAVAASIGLGQEPRPPQLYPSIFDIFQVPEANTVPQFSPLPVTEPKLGGGSVYGFPFSVSRRFDGALPLVRVMPSAPVSSSQRLTLYRKVNSTTFALYCDWDQSLSPAGEKGGVLLQPGEYIFETFSSLPDDYPIQRRMMVRLSGVWVPEAQANTYWSMTPGANAIATRAIQGQPLTATGLLFTVTARPADSAWPVLTNALCRDGMAGSQIRIYRNIPSHGFAAYITWNQQRNGNSTPGIIIPPGEYLLELQSLPTFVNLYRYANVLSGYWSTFS